MYEREWAETGETAARGNPGELPSRPASTQRSAGSDPTGINVHFRTVTRHYQWHSSHLRKTNWITWMNKIINVLHNAPLSSCSLVLVKQMRQWHYAEMPCTTFTRPSTKFQSFPFQPFWGGFPDGLTFASRVHFYTEFFFDLMSVLWFGPIIGDWADQLHGGVTWLSIGHSSSGLCSFVNLSLIQCLF